MTSSKVGFYLFSENQPQVMAAMGFRDHLATFSVVGEPWEMRVDRLILVILTVIWLGKIWEKIWKNDV